MIEDSNVFPGLMVKIGSVAAVDFCGAPEVAGFTFRLEEIGKDWMILRMGDCRPLAATFAPGTTKSQMIELLKI